MSDYNERDEDLQLAIAASHVAAELALAHFEAGVSTTLKADGTPVTEADREVERSLQKTLSAACPRRRVPRRGTGTAG